MKTGRRRFGFALLELLVVLVMLAIVAGYYFKRGGGGGATSRSTYEMSVKKSQDTACVANRAAFRTSLEMFRMSNPNVPLTKENLLKGGVNMPSCPEGGEYKFAADGQLICSRHAAGGSAESAAGVQIPAIPGVPAGAVTGR